MLQRRSTTIAAEPTLAIVLFTYGGTPARQHYARITLRSLLEHVRFSGQWLLHIADDGSPGWFVDELIEMVEFLGPVIGPAIAITHSDAHRGGYGRNYNLATQTVHELADYVLAVEDDWQLQRELDVDALLPAANAYGCVRLGYIGSTQELRGRIEYQGEGTYLVFDPASPEPHVFAGHPRLETVAWQQRVGPWPEGLSPGETEFAVAHMPAAREGVVWPMHLVLAAGGMFDHIGEVHSEEGAEEMADAGVD